MSAFGILGMAALALGGAGAGPTARPKDVLRAVMVSTTVALDGRLDEPFWAEADSIDGFRQREPDEGTPATERTVVRVAVDGTALYIGVRAYEPPDEMRASQLRRDAGLYSDDNVEILIDSFDEQRSAFIFQTNPNGARVDGQLQGSGHPNHSWNGIWDVAVSQDSTGWTAEFRIPFETLRFRPGTRQFGFNVKRFIRVKNEEDLWRGWGRTEGLYRQVYEGQLTGVGRARRGGAVAFRPYALGRLDQAGFDTTGVPVQRAIAVGKVGLDAKLPVSGTLTADLTVNTDFAQVEADQQMINLTRYPLFFPEKREFFLESSGIFDFGTSRQVQMFYSRRIGLGDDGPVPILAGARLYGRSGPWVLGLLDARTGTGDRANDVVLRVRHDLLRNSYVGLMATARTGPGVAGGEGAIGMDADLPLTLQAHNIEPSFWIMTTRTPDASGDPVAWRVALDYPNDVLRGSLSFERVADGLNPTLGFVRRTDVLETSGRVELQPRPPIAWLRRLDFKLIPSWEIETPTGGRLADPRDWETARLEWRPLGGDLQSGDHFELNIQRLLDAPSDTFSIYEGIVIQPGRYWWTRADAQYNTSAAGPLGLDANIGWGGFYDGSDLSLQLHGTWRAGGHLIVETNLNRDAVRLSAGRFVATVVGTRIQYAFSTRADLLTYAQYNGESRRADFDLRFHWIPRIGDDVYVVWNSGYATGPNAEYRFPGIGALRRPLDGALVLKVVYRMTS
jgi:Domain of unknown function (DUF5916)/Carbohydrate family 9 binding domain-like